MDSFISRLTALMPLDKFEIVTNKLTKSQYNNYSLYAYRLPSITTLGRLLRKKRALKLQAPSTNFLTTNLRK